MARSRQTFTGPVKVKVPSAMRGACLAMPAGLQPYGNGILVTTPLPAGTVICGTGICILESREDYKHLLAYKEAQSAKRAAKRSRPADEAADEAADEVADSDADEAYDRRARAAILAELADSDDDEEPYTKRQATPARMVAPQETTLIEDEDGNFVEVPVGAGAAAGAGERSEWEGDLEEREEW